MEKFKIEITEEHEGSRIDKALTTSQSGLVSNTNPAMDKRRTCPRQWKTGKTKL